MNERRRTRFRGAGLRHRRKRSTINQARRIGQLPYGIEKDLFGRGIRIDLRYPKEVLLEIHFHLRDTFQPFQGRFNRVWSSHSGFSASTFLHPLNLDYHGVG